MRGFFIKGIRGKRDLLFFTDFLNNGIEFADIDLYKVVTALFMAEVS